jgi:hypothetical protein
MAKAKSAKVTSAKAKKTTPAGRASKRKAGVEEIHEVMEGLRVTYRTSGHPPRADSPQYAKSRAALKKIASAVPDWYYAHEDEPYQDHHGGGLWLHDDQGWFFVRNLVSRSLRAGRRSNGRRNERGLERVAARERVAPGPRRARSVLSPVRARLRSAASRRSSWANGSSPKMGG